MKWTGIAEVKRNATEMRGCRGGRCLSQKTQRNCGLPVIWLFVTVHKNETAVNAMELAQDCAAGFHPTEGSPVYFT